jgi:hypothetical protein
MSSSELFEDKTANDMNNSPTELLAALIHKKKSKGKRINYRVQ